MDASLPDKLGEDETLSTGDIAARRDMVPERLALCLRCWLVMVSLKRRNRFRIGGDRRRIACGWGKNILVRGGLLLHMGEFHGVPPKM